MVLLGDDLTVQKWVPDQVRDDDGDILRQSPKSTATLPLIRVHHLLQVSRVTAQFIEAGALQLQAHR